MKKIDVAIIGCGNIGKYAVQAVLSENDMHLKGVVDPYYQNKESDELKSTRVVDDIKKLGCVDVAILCTPSRITRNETQKYLKEGICTVDCYDIHGQSMYEYKMELNRVAIDCGIASIISAGWDPGSNSLIRAVMKLMVPQGMTYTNYGPGMSMGHSVVVKGIEGVDDAVSLTMPLDTGLHRRLVYVKLQPGSDFEKIKNAIKMDAYFINDETHVYAVDDLKNFKDMGHGVHIEHKGKAGDTHNQILNYAHTINNPAVTGQVMVSSARAVIKQKPGCYSMLEVPLVDYLNVTEEEMLKHMV